MSKDIVALSADVVNLFFRKEKDKDEDDFYDAMVALNNHLADNFPDAIKVDAPIYPISPDQLDQI